MADETNPNLLAQLNIAELHDLGLDYLARARQQYNRDPSPGAAASIAIACFFSSMSADNLAAAGGSHRSDDTPPARPPQEPDVAPGNEFAGNHG